MDDIARYNVERWRGLVESGAFWTRPWFDLSVEEAQRRVNRHGLFADLNRKRVLLVAGGGGQQSAAFALLGAHVIVTDLSEDQLERDRAVAEHRGLHIETLQADMRDLSALPAAAFDVVWHGYSINFVPEIAPVFAEIARVIRPHGWYRMECANPYFHGLSERDWTRDGYSLRDPYGEGTVVMCEDSSWIYEGREPDTDTNVQPAREYRHTLATVVNALANQGFVIQHVTDQPRQADPNAVPGTWAHFISVCPQWLTFIARHEPGTTGSRPQCPGTPPDSL